MESILGVNYFGVMDYVMLAATLLSSLLIGLYFGYSGNKTNEDLLVGGRTMSVFPVAASSMVSYISAITIIGLPSEIYAHGSEVFMLTIVSCVAMALSPLLFVPFFYPMKLTSIYEYLENRFQTMWVRRLASVIFIIQAMLLNGVVLYAPSIALEVFLGFPMWISIIATGICATLYTNIGGIKAVVWTDFLQFLIMIGGMLIIVWKGFTSAGGVTSALKLSYERGRMELFNFTFDPFTKQNFWNVLLGLGMHGFFQPGVHQLQVQRYSGMPSARKAILALVLSPPLKMLIMTLCLLTGYAIFAFYANCDPVASGKIGTSEQILPYFVIQETRDIPGMVGIFTSCIFCAVLSSLSSGLNSMAAVTWEDFVSHIDYFRKMTASGQTNVTRMIGAFYGIVLIILAFYAGELGGVYVSSYAVVLATAGVIYGIFIMAMFLPFVDGKGAGGGGLIAIVTVLTIRAIAFTYQIEEKFSLPTSIEQCPGGLNVTLAPSVPFAAEDSNVDGISLEHWPWKFFQLSYLLYPILGTMLALFLGILISFISSSGFTSDSYQKTLPKAKYVHPSVRRIFRRYLAYGLDDEHFNGSIKDKKGSIDCSGLQMNKIAS